MYVCHGMYVCMYIQPAGVVEPFSRANFLKARYARTAWIFVRATRDLTWVFVALRAILLKICRATRDPPVKSARYARNH